VLKLKKSGSSLRAIAAETNLSLRTIRTIVSKADGTDAATKRTHELRRKELDRQRAAAFRARKSRRDQIPKDVTETLKRGETLINAAKGLGR
jgi:transposase